jgi:hypothetical protein
MRIIRLTIAVMIFSPIFVIAFGESSLGPRLLAQATPQPGPAPLTAPAAPGQPNSFATIGALPALAPAPGTTNAAFATATPTPRVFRCTCSGPGHWTQWTGSIASSSYFLANQSAVGQCVAFLFNENAPSPFIASGSNTSSTVSSAASSRAFLSNGSVFNSSGTTGITNGAVGQNQTVNLARARLAGNCTQCACN